jgi:hypothetical protein
MSLVKATSFAPKIALVKSHTDNKKEIPLCQNFEPFILLGLKILVLMCQYDTIKKSFEPLTRILIRGSFSFIDLIEKRKGLISPPTYFISIVFHSKH